MKVKKETKLVITFSSESGTDIAIISALCKATDFYMSRDAASSEDIELLEEFTLYMRDMAN